MTLVEGSQIESSQASGPFPDTNSEQMRPPKVTGGKSELSGHFLGEIGGVRTEVQVRPFEGFAQGEVQPRDGMRWGSNGSPTKLLAQPPSWVPESTPCTVPPETVWTKAMKEAHWDARTDEEAAALCSACPVRETCLQDALDHERDENGKPLSAQGRFMVRGGFTPKGRWQISMKAPVGEPGASLA